MTLHRRDLTWMPTDTAVVGAQVLGETNAYRIIGEQLADLVTDEEFAGLYQQRGRAALPPSLLALVTLFQFWEDLPDRMAAEQVVVRLDWKYALHLPLTYGGFDFSCLSYFRQRLRAHDQERLLFDTLLRRIQAQGLLQRRRQRTDSLGVLGAVRQLSVLELVTETLRLALGALAAADPGWVAQEVPASFREQYAQPRAPYRLTDRERQAALVQTGEDGVWLLGRLDAAETAALVALDAVQTLRTVWMQRYQVVGARVVVQTAEVVATERIVTPHDPGVRVGQKRGKAWVGDKVHITETAEPVTPEQPNFITDVTTAPAPSGDVGALPQIRAQLAARDLLPAEQIVDSGYVSGQQLAQSAAAGVALVGPPLPDTSPQEFKLADFQVDRAARRAICPQGHAAVRWRVSTERDGSQAVHIQFAAAVCAACPLRARCTKGQGGRSLHVSEHYEVLVAHRAAAQTAAFQQEMRARPGVEATLSELVRGQGLRRHRYRGAQQRHMEHLLKAAACNLKRLVGALVAVAQRAVGVISPYPPRAAAM